MIIKRPAPLVTRGKELVEGKDSWNDNGQGQIDEPEVAPHGDPELEL